MSCEEVGKEDSNIETDEIFLGEHQGWVQEAQSVIKDIDGFVRHVEIAEKLESSKTHIYLNLTTMEEQQYTIELTSQGFRIASLGYNSLIQPEPEKITSSFFETPYSLLESISPAYTSAFGAALVKKLTELQQQ